MKKIFTLFSFFLVGSVFAGTPTINGVYSASEGWGTEVATGNGTAGWSNANAKKLYVTYVMIMYTLVLNVQQRIGNNLFLQ